MRTAILALGLASLASCDCIQQVEGVVVDIGTSIPIEDVTVRKRYSDGTYHSLGTTTNFVGAFEFNGISGGPWGCPDVQLHFEKPGYQPVIRTFSALASRDTIRLKALD